MEAGRAVSLSGQQLKKLSEAMRDAYLDRADLEMLLTYNLDKPPETLEGGALATCVYKLLMKARSEGWLHDLVNAVIKERPGNAQLKAWIDSVDQPPALLASTASSQRNPITGLSGSMRNDSFDGQSDNVIPFDKRRRSRAAPRRRPAKQGETGDLSALVSALRSARFDTSNWRTISSRTSRLKKELARVLALRSALPENAVTLATDLARMLAIASEPSAGPGTVRSMAARCDRARDLLLGLLARTGCEDPDGGGRP